MTCELPCFFFSEYYLLWSYQTCRQPENISSATVVNYLQQPEQWSSTLANPFAMFRRCNRQLVPVHQLILAQKTLNEKGFNVHVARPSKARMVLKIMFVCLPTVGNCIVVPQVMRVEVL